MSRWFRTRFDNRYKVDVVTGSLLRISTGEEIFGNLFAGYLRLYYAGRTRGMHVIIWAEANGRWPKSSTQADENGNKWSIGHMDDVKSNNWASNLREMTYGENNKMASKNRDYKKILEACKTPIPVIATNLRTNVKVPYKSMYACSKALKINVGLVSMIMHGIGKSATSKKEDKDKYTFDHDREKSGGCREQKEVREEGEPTRAEAEAERA